MTACATCKHWLRDKSPLRLANMASCALNARWEYLPPHHACGAYSALESALFANRSAWLQRNKYEVKA